MKSPKLILAALIMVGGNSLAIAPAWAKCVPPCTGGDVCRYEAAGDKFYCKAPPTSADTDDKDNKDSDAKKKPQTPTELPKPKQILQR